LSAIEVLFCRSYRGRDTDDLFYDAARKRLYVSGGEGLPRSPLSRRAASRQPEGGDSRVRGAL